MPSVPNFVPIDPLEPSEEFASVPFPILSKHLHFNLQRQHENQKRLGDFGPRNEVLLNIPDDGPGWYFKRFSSDGRVKCAELMTIKLPSSLYCTLVYVCFWW